MGRDKKKKKAAAAAGAAPAGAKNKAKEEQKKLKKQQTFKVTEEVDCPPPTRRGNASLTVNPLNPSELILFGGEYYDGRTVHMFNDFYRFNVEKREWKKITSPNSPAPRSSHQAIATPAGRLFIWGGEFVSPNETNFFHYKLRSWQDFWTMDLKTYAWEKLELKTRPSPRSGHRMVLWKHYIVMFGGFFDNYTQTIYATDLLLYAKHTVLKSNNDLWLFDTIEYKWIKLEVPEPRPTPRSGFQMFAYNDTICVYGGYSKTFVKGQKPVGVVHSDMWVLKMSLQLETIRWERRKKPGGLAPNPRSGCTMTMYKGRGIMFGGISDLQESEETIESVCHKDMFQYMIDSNKWFPMTLRSSGKSKPRRNKNKAVNTQQQHSKQSRQSGQYDSDDSDESKENAASEDDDEGQNGEGDDGEFADEDEVDKSEQRRSNAAQSSSKTASTSAVTPSAESAPSAESQPTAPFERFSPMLAVSRNTLYL
eukprot:jgi/Hompol1/4938/HPOL_000458-RA